MKDHIDDVGHQRLSIQDMALPDLKSHFRRLMKLSNIVLVLSVFKGLGDIPAFFEASKRLDRR
jgi:hypothetical protein